MNFDYFQDAKKKLKEKYQVDVVDDILLNFQDKVICYADHSDPDKVELEVISGSLENIGFDDKKKIELSEIISHFDYSNEYGKVAGRMDYFKQVHRKIYDFANARDVSFPILYNGIRKWLRFNIYPILKNPNISVFTMMDVTKLHTEEEKTYAKTHTDSLTKMFNKYTFDYHYGRVYLLPGFHVMYLDIDDFKDINDTYGHDVGDEYLKAIADILKSFESEYNVFYHLGGDEFLGLLNGSTKQIKTLAKTIINKIREIKISGRKVNLTVSMGVVKATKSVDVARKADNLMYKVKEGGKDNFLYEIEKD